MFNVEHLERKESRYFPRECDARHNLLFNYWNLLFLVFLCKKRYFRFRLFISLFLGAFNAF